MSNELEKTERPRELELLVADSGRTWLVVYDEINRIPPDALELGDVLIATHPTEPGRMVLQATHKPPPGRWVFSRVEFKK